MARLQIFGLISFLLLLSAHSAIQETPLVAKKELPKAVSASVPFYPALARQTRIQGTVTLWVSTDGKRVSAVEAKSGHPILVEAATDNIKTWEFKPHAPTSFEVTFRYRLFIPKCDSECNCDQGEHGEKESVVLHLPTDADLIAPTFLTCDPAVEIRRKK